MSLRSGTLLLVREIDALYSNAMPGKVLHWSGEANITAGTGITVEEAIASANITTTASSEFANPDKGTLENPPVATADGSGRDGFVHTNWQVQNMWLLTEMTNRGGGKGFERFDRRKYPTKTS